MPPSIPISSLLNSSDNVQRPIALFSNRSDQRLLLNIDSAPTIRRNVYTNPKTTLSVLYTYEDANAWVEYPESNLDRPVGYLFRCDPSNWENPVRNFAYSLGKPSGQTRKGEEVQHPLLVDKDGNKVFCAVAHLTCQGSKVCPMSNQQTMLSSHVSASREDVKARLQKDRQYRINTASPTRDIFQKTSAFIAALQQLGCCGPIHEPTVVSAGERELRDFFAAHKAKIQRGYTPLRPSCDGRLELWYSQMSSKPSIQCEHYSWDGNRDHLKITLDESLDLEYIDAHFNEDTEEVDRIELRAAEMGYGPRVTCTTITNFSAQRICCPCDHRDEGGRLVKPEMIHLKCRTKFRIFEPVAESRFDCPYILVTICGEHPHPIPLPQKTPPAIRKEIFHLLGSMDEDLPDLTSRKFIRHSILKAYLQKQFPNSLRPPTISDLHVSLANRAHLASYIELAKKTHFPAGTGWEGLILLKRMQDESLATHLHYIRRMIYMVNVPTDEDDLVTDGNDGCNAQIVICMTSEGSRRLLNAQYIQSDMAFKRVVGYYEFELATVDRITNTSVTFCRVFATSQSAAVHQRIFQEIEEIVKIDTGEHLRWRHLHAQHAEDMVGMILLWTFDQHGGQAKGLGLHLRSLAQLLPNKYDLHEPTRILASLGPYDHLRRLVRICYTHAKRNIQKCNVSVDVRKLMRSLLCLTHPDWDGTLELIRQHGGKAGADWLQDKIRSKFAFPAICWEKSFIPREVWNAGDSTSNLIESVHSDVNREGIACTLVGGVKKGQAFDHMKMTSLKALEDFGIRSSKSAGHLSENASKSVKRKFIAHHNQLTREDMKIENQNKKVRTAHEKLLEKQRMIEILAGSTSSEPHAFTKAITTLEKSSVAFDKAVNVTKSLAGTGSGKVHLLLPSSVVADDL